MQATDAGIRHLADHCGASAHGRVWCFAVVDIDTERIEFAAASFDPVAGSPYVHKAHHGFACTSDVAAVDGLQRCISYRCVLRLAGFASAVADRSDCKHRRRQNRFGPRGLVAWNVAKVKLFFTAPAHTTTHNVTPKGKKCDTHNRSRQHAVCGQRHTSPALSAVTVPVAKHDIEGDTYQS